MRACERSCLPTQGLQRCSAHLAHMPAALTPLSKATVALACTLLRAPSFPSGRVSSYASVVRRKAA